MRVESDVVTAADGRSSGRSFLRFVRTNINRLREPQLEAALGAVALEDLPGLVMQCLPDSRDVAPYRSVTRRTRFLTINAEIRVVRQEIKVVAECLT